MRAVFVETTNFTDSISFFLSDGEYSRIQSHLMQDPNSGDVITGCDGLRKLRTKDQQRRRGSRGGARIIYLHVPAANRFYMIDIYGKNEKDDLSGGEKKLLKQLVQQLKKEVSAKSKRSN